MAKLFEGDCVGKAINVETGPDKNGNPRVKWQMLVTEGEHKSKVASYSGKLDADNIKWTKRDMIAVGWQGKDLRTFVDDVKKADKLVPFTAEIARFERDDGSVSEWTSARMSGGGQPLGQFDKDAFDKLNGWFKEAGDVGGGPKPGDDIPF